MRDPRQEQREFEVLWEVIWPVLGATAGIIMGAVVGVATGGFVAALVFALAGGFVGMETGHLLGGIVKLAFLPWLQLFRDGNLVPVIAGAVGASAATLWGAHRLMDLGSAIGAACLGFVGGAWAVMALQLLFGFVRRSLLGIDERSPPEGDRGPSSRPEGRPR